MRPDSGVGVAEGCRVLEWDSGFFGHRIARIEPSALKVDDGRAAEAWCTDQQVECAYLLVEPADQPTLDLAAASGYRLVDLRVTLDLDGPALASHAARPPAPGVRPAADTDIPALKAIARVSHRDTRFYADPRFDRARCDDLYELWIEKSCRGWASHVIVAERHGAPVGYLTCHLEAEQGRIGLVGVSASSRGQGSGSALVGEALRWFAQAGARRASVATQGRNEAGLRLYQRAGFSVADFRLSFHKWF